MPQSADKPLFTTLRFIPTIGTPPTHGTKRIAAHACETCRRKKKRCTHNSDELLASSALTAGDGDGNVASATRVASAPSVHRTRLNPAGPNKRRRASETTTIPGRASTINHSRFIGDLNPDVELLSGATANEPLRNNVGVWHVDDVHPTKSTASGDMFTPLSLFHTASPSSQKLVLPLVEELSLRVRPPALHFHAMEKFYFERIDPILPAIDTATYHNAPAGSPARMLQEHIICILAALNPAMSQHLLLQTHGELLSPSEFARKVVGGMRLAIECSLVSDKTTIIRALVAMSLITYGPESIDLTSQFFVRAVHLGYTIGLHLPQDQTRDQQIAGLFCYVWSIDRLHAAVQGRPIFMHAIDMGKDPRDSMVSQNLNPGSQVLTYIATLLDKTIALYRPGAVEREIADVDYPTFEEILSHCGALALPSDLLSTLELFYHAVGILSCRHRSGTSSQDHQARNARQLSSAMQIGSIMDGSPVEMLVLLPFVPYAVSLALSAAYRDFKHCKAAHHRHRARKRLVQSNRHLLTLARVSWSAAFVSGLATKILQDTEDADEAAQGSNPDEEDQSSLSKHAPQSVDVTLGHDWNSEDMDQFLAGSLDPSQPWDIEGFLAFSAFEQSGSFSTI